MKKTDQAKPDTAKTLSRIALSTVLIVVCSWISVPYVIPFTLQTFAVFFALELLGGKSGTVSVCVYVLLAAVGVPVLSGFKGGIGALAGPTGGYVIGFVLSGLTYLVLPFKGKSFPLSYLACSIALLVCYVCGTLWFWLGYLDNGTIDGLLYALSVCVAPYAAIDLIKIFFAVLIADKLKKLISI